MTDEKRIMERALEAGASLAGIADVAQLRNSPSHVVYDRLDYYGGVGTPEDKDKNPAEKDSVDWPAEAASALVVALSHPEESPELDWWAGKGTKGNRMLMGIVKEVREWIGQELEMTAFPLHYYVEKGGVFLKDAAVLAGLGSLGHNNLLITPEYGPRVRLRALFLSEPLTPTGPVSFDPCSGCPVDCRSACPRKAMNRPLKHFREMDDIHLPAGDGAYNRLVCNKQMEADMAAARSEADDGAAPIKYCRACEFICPAGR